MTARAATIARLSAAIREFARAYPELRPDARLAGGWGPREVLCHLVYWHETYVAIAHALNRHTAPPVKEGVFPEFNRRAVVELGEVPARTLLDRLLEADRRLAAELAALAPGARIRIKTGAKARGPVEFADRIEAHVRAHLVDLRSASRKATGPPRRVHRPLAVTPRAQTMKV